jgi:hypoxanthine phosphoribosyltransferase
MKRQFVTQANLRHARIIVLSRGGLSNARIVQQMYDVALSPPKEFIGLAVWCLSKLRE